MYVHNSDHILDKNSVPLQQPYPSSVSVGGILTATTNVSHAVDSGMPIPDVSSIQLNPVVLDRILERGLINKADIADYALSHYLEFKGL